MLLPARNVNRTYLCLDQSLANNFTSEIIDWREMTVGSLQIKWDGNDKTDGEFSIEASDIPEDGWFDEIDHCPTFTDASGSGRGNKKVKLFNLGVLGYRYSRLKYYKGTNTTGTFTAIAIGKKNG